MDLDIRIADAEGKPIKQGAKFQNTGVILSAKELKKVENHLYNKNGRKSHSLRKRIFQNQQIKNKKEQ